MTAPAADEIEAIRARWTGDGPQAWRSGAEARDVRTLLAALDDARAEVERLRGKLTEMHRRAQRAEGIADRYAEGRPQGAHGRSVGRALANYAAHRATQQRDEAIAERDAARREAIEEAIAACERKRKEYARLATKDGYSHCHDRADGARECVGELRALLDGPAREGCET